MPYESNDLLLRHFEEIGTDLTQQVDAQIQLIAPNSPNIPLCPRRASKSLTPLNGDGQGAAPNWGPQGDIP